MEKDQKWIDMGKSINKIGGINAMRYVLFTGFINAITD